MIHPRLPPLVRPLPSFSSLALFHDEEGKDERVTRESLGLQNSTESRENGDMDVDMPEAHPEPSRTTAASTTSASHVSNTTAVSSSMVDLPLQPATSMPALVSQPNANETSRLAEIATAQLAALTKPNNGSVKTAQVTAKVVEKEVLQETAVGLAEGLPMPPTQPPTASSNISPSRPLEPPRTFAEARAPDTIVVDSDESDIEYPTLNLESDTDSGEE